MFPEIPGSVPFHFTAPHCWSFILSMILALMQH